MYVPSHFAETRPEVLHEAIHAARLVSLVTAGPAGIEVSHLPVLLDPEHGAHGRLVGHLARANPHWKAADGATGLAIVLGPDAYVTPSWYPSKREGGRVVPTWNYVAVHVHGVVRAFHERERLLDVVERLTDRHEAGRPHPWKVSDAPPEYLDGMLKAIVGVELEITRIEGKWKVSQNRAGPDLRGAIDGMREDGHEAMARLMEAAAPRGK